VTASEDIVVPIDQWPTPALIVRSCGRIVAANAAMARCLGTEAKTLAGTALAARSLDEAKLTAFLQKGSDTACETRFRANDGSARLLALSIARGAVPTGDLITAVDMTLCRAGEHKLREERDRYLDMIRAGSDWFYESETTRESGDETEARVCLIRSGADGALEQIELHTKWPGGLVDRSYDREGLAQHMKRISGHGPFRDLIHRQVDEHGKERYFRASGVPYLRDGHHAGYRGISTNVTAQVRATQALRRERHLLEAAQSVAGYGSAARDVATGGESWSRELCRLLDIDAAVVASGEKTVAGVVDNADRARLETAIRSTIAGAPLPPATFRFVKPCGTIRPLDVEMKLLRGFDGNPETLLMVFRDAARKG
jgi:PAS domain-containing protein